MDPRQILATFRKSRDSDILVYVGDIDSQNADDLVRYNVQRRTNVALFLETPGGDADGAYRIARMLQQKYEKFTVFVDGPCKSAGTLLSLGANEVVMSDAAELGPLDVQVHKPGEFGESTSGFTLIQALNGLESRAFSAFEQFFLQLRLKSGLQISTQGASQTAAQLVTGLYAPVFSQAEPSRFGELDRATKVSMEYGKRLDRNLKGDGLARLVAGYPSHSFVIDLKEARELFKNVRAPNPDELSLMEILRPVVTLLGRSDYNGTQFLYLDESFFGQDDDESVVTEDGKTDGASESPPASQVEGQDQDKDAGSFGHDAEGHNAHNVTEEGTHVQEIGGTDSGRSGPGVSRGDQDNESQPPGDQGQGGPAGRGQV